MVLVMWSEKRRRVSDRDRAAAILGVLAPLAQGVFANSSDCLQVSAQLPVGIIEMCDGGEIEGASVDQAAMCRRLQSMGPKVVDVAACESCNGLKLGCFLAVLFEPRACPAASAWAAAEISWLGAGIAACLPTSAALEDPLKFDRCG